MPRTVLEPQANYWHETTRQIIVSTHLDKKATRGTNAAFLLLNVVPFGTPRVTA